jgi:hypothetical protein
MIPIMSQKQVREVLRTRAHRTIITAAVNAALAQRIIGRGNGENHWPGAPESKEHVFRFTFLGGIPAAAYIHDLGQELAFHVALWPNGDLNRLAASNAGPDAGEAFVGGCSNATKVCGCRTGSAMRAFVRSDWWSCRK